MSAQDEIANSILQTVLRIVPVDCNETSNVIRANSYCEFSHKQSHANLSVGIIIYFAVAVISLIVSSLAGSDIRFTERGEQQGVIGASGAQSDGIAGEMTVTTKTFISRRK